MKKSVLIIAAFMLGAFMSVAIQACADDDQTVIEEPNSSNNGGDNECQYQLQNKGEGLQDVLHLVPNKLDVFKIHVILQMNGLSIIESVTKGIQLVNKKTTLIPACNK